MVGAFGSSLPAGTCKTDLVKSGWYFTDVVTDVFGTTTFAVFAGSFFSAALVGTVSRGLIAGFTSACDGAVTEVFFTGSTAFSFSCFTGAAAFFTGAAFSGVFLLIGCFATGLGLAGALAGAACFGAGFFAAVAAPFLTDDADVLVAT